MRTCAQRNGFSLIELLVVVAVIVVLAAILAPVAQGVLINARQSKGAEQMRQIGIALQLYAQEHSHGYPPVAVASVPWDEKALDAYLGDRRAPAFDGGGNAESTDGWDVRRAYSAGGGLLGLTRWNQAINTSVSRSILTIENPSDAVLFFDGRVTWHGLCRDGVDWGRFSEDVQNASVQGNKYIDYRHKGKAQFFFADMHVEALTPEEVNKRFSESRKIYEGL